jgi:NCAIR mutase (PurE)-related protein
MDEKKLKTLLHDVANGRRSPAGALDALKNMMMSDLGYARVDHHRMMRCGFPEVILCEGKTPAQVAGISREILKRSEVLLATRATREVYNRLKRISKAARYNAPGRCVVIDRRKGFKRAGLVMVVTAGTSDIPVAEEARTTADVMGARVETLYDAGVAGIHRLMGSVERLREARALVVAAGMEGALASVVGGLVDRPVIAVPTSIGYGASFGGVAALLGMLNSCAANVSLVNIDNGFGAGYIAAMINRNAGS